MAAVGIFFPFAELQDSPQDQRDKVTSCDTDGLVTPQSITGDPASRVDWETGTPEWPPCHLLPNSTLHIYALKHPQMGKYLCSSLVSPSHRSLQGHPSFAVSHTQNLCPGEPSDVPWSFPLGCGPCLKKQVQGNSFFCYPEQQSGGCLYNPADTTSVAHVFKEITQSLFTLFLWFHPFYSISRSCPALSTLKHPSILLWKHNHPVMHLTLYTHSIFPIPFKWFL